MLAFLSFFEELEDDVDETEEAPSRRRARMPRRPGGPRVPGGPRTPGLQRLALLAGVVLFVAVIAIWQIRSCQRDAEVEAHKNFVTSANATAKASTDVGKEFSSALIQQGQQPDALLKTIESDITKQETAVRNARELDGPGGLGNLQPEFVQAMQFRVSGLEGVREALENAFSNQNKQSKAVQADDARKVAVTLERLVASDVVYADAYREPALAVLKDKNIEGVQVDESRFLSDQVVSLVAPSQMKTVLDAILGGGGSTQPGTDGPSSSQSQTDTTGGRHGVQVDGASIIAGGGAAVQLDESKLNEADATNNNTLRVQIKNSGDFAESDLTVTATIGDVEKSASITALGAGEQSTVDIKFSVEDLDITLETQITVTAEPVPNEFNADNNQKKYRVQFKLPS